MTLAIFPLAHLQNLRHTKCVAKTTATWFSSRNRQRRTNRRPGGIFTSVRTCAPSLGGRLWGGFGLPVSFVTGLLTLLSARPPHLAVGSGSNPTEEVAMRLNALARPEQTQSPTELTPFQAGIQSARAWFACPQLSAATHRDNARCVFVRAIADDSEAAIASFSFNRGFAHGLAKAMAEVSHG